MERDRLLSKVRRRIKRCQRSNSGRHVHGDEPAAQAQNLAAYLMHHPQPDDRPYLPRTILDNDVVVALAWFYHWRLQGHGVPDDRERFRVLSAIARHVSGVRFPTHDPAPLPLRHAPDMEFSVAMERLSELIDWGTVTYSSLKYHHDEAARLIGVDDHATAAKMLSNLVPNCIRLLGPDHIDTLIAQHQLAGALNGTGHHARAVKPAGEAATGLARILGPEHRGTIRSRHVYALALGGTGELAQAVKMYDELLPQMTRVLGPDDLDTLSARTNHAFFTGNRGDIDGAVRLYQEIIPHLERALGAQAPTTLLARRAHAQFVAEAGNPAEGLRLLTDLLPALARSMGESHPQVRSARETMARWQDQQR